MLRNGHPKCQRPPPLPPLDTPLDTPRTRPGLLGVRGSFSVSTTLSLTLSSRRRRRIEGGLSRLLDTRRRGRRRHLQTPPVRRRPRKYPTMPPRTPIRGPGPALSEAEGATREASARGSWSPDLRCAPSGAATKRASEPALSEVEVGRSDKF